MIDYLKIANAIEFYRHNGYTLLDVPWTVPKGVMAVTTPDRVNLDNCRYLDKYLIGSAEQSFIEMIENNQLPFDKCCAITPCFRDDEEDKYHQKYFMKLELIHYQHPVNRSDERMEVNLYMMICDASQFFGSYLPVVVKKTDDPNSVISYDIEHAGIELGSYGIREHEGNSWIYGTGLAEPRLSILYDRS